VMLSVAQTTQYWLTGWLMNNESERIWKEAVMDSFMVLSWHLPRGNEENHKNPQSG
jgi:hypothetical protein